MNIKKVGIDSLRNWLENKSYLKIFSLTPSGIYDLGGADSSRIIKWCIPSVCIEYLREHIEPSPGKANALWWLSRGIPRHIIQNLRLLNEISEKDGPYKINETLKLLECIGKEPGRVNAVEITWLNDNSRIKSLLDLIPQPSESSYPGFVITKELDEGKLSNIFQEIFNLTQTEEEKELALLMAYYFKSVAMTISDEDFTSYLSMDEITEFMRLTMDILLENEYKKPVVEKNMAKLLTINEKLKDEHLLREIFLTDSVPGIHRHQKNLKKLPFTISEYRKLFPLHMANPVIKSNPDKVINEIEGNGKPVCRDDTFMFFASYRDFKAYLVTPAFTKDILPDDKYFVILIPEFGCYKNDLENPTSKDTLILKWLIDNGKLKVVEAPSAIKIFLLSLYGYENNTYNIHNIAEQITSSQDISLKKKFEIYYTALNELNEDNKPDPKNFFKGKQTLEGATTVWGASKLGDTDIAVSGLAIAFYNVFNNDKMQLNSIRELFKTEKRRGVLADINVGNGLPTLADDLLPKKNSKGILTDSSITEKLRNFWTKEEGEELDKLSSYLELSEFKELSNDADHQRILEAFWRGKRDKFDMESIDGLKRKLTEVIEKLKIIQKIEKNCNDYLQLSLIFEKGYDENIIKSLDGLKELTKLSFRGNLPNFIFKLYLKQTLLKIENIVVKLHNEIEAIDRNVDDLRNKKEEMIAYLTDKKKMLTFISDEVTFNKVEEKLSNLIKIENDLNLSESKQETQ